MLDPSGRVLIIHGANLSSKGYGAVPATPQGVNFAAADVNLLAHDGFNAVRLTFERYQFEPQPGRFNDAYARQFAGTVRMLWRRGIHSLIDFHQDDYGPVFTDNGFPAWMTITDGLPNDDTLPFPLQYFHNPAMRRAWDHFWSNSRDPAGRSTLQADDAMLLQRAVRDLQNTPGILGFEILNEPFAGTDDQRCYDVATGCTRFERKLDRYYKRIVLALRPVDHTHLFFYEPQVGFDFSIPTNVRPPKDPELGFAYHDYCVNGAVATALFGSQAGRLVTESCAQIDQRVVANALQQVRTTGNALLQTEFGVEVPGENLSQMTDLYDANMVPWMYWNYNTLVGATAHGGELIPNGPRKPDAATEQALVRPYPQLIAGIPLSWSLSRSTETLQLRYTTRHAKGTGQWPAGSGSVIYLPALQYPSGYHVQVTGGVVVSTRKASRLTIASCPHAALVTVQVSRTGRSSNGCKAS